MADLERRSTEMSMTPDTPTEAIQANSRELVDELFRRGFGVDEVCEQTGVSGQDELWRLLAR
jgi:hypothetical protein